MTRGRRLRGLAKTGDNDTALKTFRAEQTIVQLVIVKENSWSIKGEFAWINFQTFLTVACLTTLSRGEGTTQF